MSDGSRKFTNKQIEELTFGIESLDQAQRQRVRDHLHRLLAKTGGTLYRQSTHLELMKMRHENVISEIDLHNIDEALFG